MEAILKRRSIREYDEHKKIAYDDLKKICECGEAAPSARNQKGRAYVIVDDPKLLNQLALGPGHADFVAKAKAAIVVMGKDPANLSTPHMQVQDLSCAVENILVAATSLGIGSCYIGVYPLEERMNYYKKLLNIQGNDFPFALISLGYPKDEASFFDKAKLEDSMLYHNGC